MWLDATQAELDALLLDEPEVTEDLVLPDGTVVDKRYVALRNRLNRMSEGLANDPLENSYEIDHAPVDPRGGPTVRGLPQPGVVHRL